MNLVGLIDSNVRKAPDKDCLRYQGKGILTKLSRNFRNGPPVFFKAGA